MKAVILAGGLGTRMQDLTRLIPKPMIEIGAHPILWHVMKVFGHYGVANFCVALGYRSEIVKEYFANYRLRHNSARIDLRTGSVEISGTDTEDWIVDLVETGALTQTGGRVARLKPHLQDAPFFLTYGDGIADVDVAALYAFHRSHGRIATVTAVRPPSRFGALDIGPDGRVGQFTEKPVSGDTWISGGFFVFEPRVFDYLTTDEDCVLERAPLERLAADGELVAYQHRGFWQGIDTARDVEHVNRLWEGGNAPWKAWA
ncbi:glucose-1-phosphate cytidylyltransferase [Kaistia algarum]|uniref:glucose-1-phosphate cytidylyltransferase n=1 Tax=Kaistia algarum TaxID=2083279 RepID=UPI000CE7D459|nr:glucose-1-phosphate cytidylyltransferase [Kaistia algarum]MCX5512649.1 glucose-1-phosphate cytidylyltransferase [Kaistia algarum]PPE82045.1 glucose-1-phosphate cytidylyltransferase [Kaistia algarum]